MYKKIINIITDKNLYVFSVITLMFFGIFAKLEYATDTYCVFATNTKQYCEHFLYSGRPISAGFLAITRLLNFSSEKIYITSYIIAIISTILAMYVLYNVLNEDIKNDILSKIISVSIIINLFSIELFLFLEKGILMLSVLFCIVAFKYFREYTESKKKKNILIAFLCMIISNFAYQGTVGIFVAISCVYIIKNFKSIKQFIVNNIVIALCYGIPASINYLIVKIVFNNNRVSNGIDVIKSIKLILGNTVQMMTESYKIVPKYTFLITFLAINIIALLSIFVKKQKKSIKCYNLLGYIYILLVTYGVTVAPQILQSTESIGFAPRNTYTFAAIIGIMLLYICFNEDNKNKIFIKMATTISIIYLMISYIGFLNIERNRYTMNYIDYYNAIQIKEKVYSYEIETGKKISKVAFYKENGVSTSYPDIYTGGDINVKAIATDWSRMDYLKYYLDRDLIETEKNEKIYDTHFKDKKWKIFDIEQIVLIDDTMHFCTY